MCDVEMQTCKLVAIPSTYPDIPFDMQTSRHTCAERQTCSDMMQHVRTCTYWHTCRHPHMHVPFLLWDRWRYKLLVPAGSHRFLKSSRTHSVTHLCRSQHALTQSDATLAPTEAGRAEHHGRIGADAVQQFTRQGHTVLGYNSCTRRDLHAVTFYPSKAFSAIWEKHGVRASDPRERSLQCPDNYTGFFAFSIRRARTRGPKINFPERAPLSPAPRPDRWELGIAKAQ